jgi:RimJ/RimL family protein N-acetyltransferase
VILAPCVALRRLQEGDLPAFAAYRADPAVARFQSWAPGYGLEDARRLLAAMEGVELGTPGRWLQLAVLDRADGTLHGDVAVRVDDDGRGAEVGVTFAPASQGRGLATEALRALLDALFGELGLQRVHAEADDRNVRVHRLLERVGMRCEARWVAPEPWKGERVTVRRYAVLAPERPTP